MECKLCGSRVETVYRPLGSKLSSSLQACLKCQFLQLKTSSDLNGENQQGWDRLSGNADYAEFRVGKAQMLSGHIDLLGEVLGELDDSAVLLDMACGRGDFLRWAANATTGSKIIGVEYSSDFLEQSREVQRDFCGRVSVTSHPELDADQVSFIYSCHTLEHFKRPLEELLEYRHRLKEGGILFLEVPDVGSISASEPLEEYFYDKHLSYFSDTALSVALSKTGFSILRKRNRNGVITVVARAQKSIGNLVEGSAASVVELVRGYEEKITRNRSIARELSEDLNEKLSRNREFGLQAVVVGCGRLFDVFVMSGLSPSLFDGFFDTYLSRALETVYGNPLMPFDPELLSDTESSEVYVFARGASAEIKSVIESRTNLKGIYVLDSLSEKLKNI